MAAAQANFDSFAAGNFGAVWDRLDASSKRLVTRAEYVQVVSACPNPLRGIPIEVVKVTEEPDGTWMVELRNAGTLQTFPARYEDGRWVFPFTPEARARFENRDFEC